MGYTNVRYYGGGMADWTEHRGPIDKIDSGLTAGQPRRLNHTRTPLRTSWSKGLDLLAGWSLEQLIGFWVGMILCFGLIYWVAGLSMGGGLQAAHGTVQPDLQGLGTALYFSFVTALSIGYGDVVPVGALRILAVTEGIAGLLTFGCVISKLVSRRQEELTEEIHQTTFEDRLDRVRTNLHLVFSDLGAVQQLQAERGALRDQVLRRLESTVRVFRGELQTIHDLLYRSQLTPDEETLESLLANLVICLQGLLDLRAGRNKDDGDSAALQSGLRAIGNLAREICGECVPQNYAPALKESMDQIQELARQLV
jgi:potassium channel LctB